MDLIDGRRILLWLWRELRVGVPIGLIAATFISVMFDDPFVRTLVYSWCIGLSIQLLIEAGRYGLAAWMRRHGRDSAALRANWPGWTWMLPWCIGAAVLGYYGGSLLADAITGGARTHSPFGNNLRALSLILMVSLGFTLAAVWFFYSRSRMLTLQTMTEAAERSAAELQLKLLQSQLEPHMLFNTLANLRVLIGTDPPRAQAMLDRLIGFLRATLAASRSGSHALADEFERLGDYLALMAVRMGPRLAVRVHLPDELRALPVPPLLLQPLVENCIQHALEPQVQGGRIDLSATRDGDMLLLRVRDTGIGLANVPASGGTRFGLRQVRERLAALYGGRASLTLEEASDGEGGTLATVRLPLQQSPS
ncbi:MAG: histidine kinase [Burkholderiaceae bacterium]|nr:histidine kinase [Burkholderiaceae bacterium]